MAFVPSGGIDSDCAYDVNKIIEVLINLDDLSIESKLTKLNSDLFNGLQNQSLILYLKQFDTKKLIKVFKNIVLKCFYLVNGDFKKCQQMINQIGKEIVVQPDIQPKEKPTNELINDNENDMGSVVNSEFRRVERNLEIIFGLNSSKNESLQIENLSGLNGLSKQDNNLSKSNDSYCKGQSHKEKSCHNKKSSHKLQKIDFNTANNNNNVSPLKNEKIAQPKNYTSCEGTLIPTVNAIDLNISNNEHSGLSKNLVHIPKIKIAEPKNYPNEKTLIPKTDTFNLTISDNEHNTSSIHGISNGINSEQSALNENKSVHTRVHTHKRKKKSQSRNELFNKETLIPMTDTLNLTISDSKRNDVLEKSNEINNEQSILRKKTFNTHKRIKIAKPRNNTNEETSSDKETLIPTTDTINLTISDNKHNNILGMSNVVNSEQSSLNKKKSVYTRVHTHKRKKKITI